jgi:hypothetical protein
MKMALSRLQRGCLELWRGLRNGIVEFRRASEDIQADLGIGPVHDQERRVLRFFEAAVLIFVYTLLVAAIFELLSSHPR